MNRTATVGGLDFEEREIPPADSFDASRGDGYHKEWVLIGGFFRAFLRFATTDEVRQIEQALRDK